MREFLEWAFSDGHEWAGGVIVALGTITFVAWVIAVFAILDLFSIWLGLLMLFAPFAAGLYLAWREWKREGKK